MGNCGIDEGPFFLFPNRLLVSEFGNQKYFYFILGSTMLERETERGTLREILVIRKFVDENRTSDSALKDSGQMPRYSTARRPE